VSNLYGYTFRENAGTAAIFPTKIREPNYIKIMLVQAAPEDFGSWIQKEHVAV
jgi:hypothetical protein